MPLTLHTQPSSYGISYSRSPIFYRFEGCTEENIYSFYLYITTGSTEDFSDIHVAMNQPIDLTSGLTFEVSSILSDYLQQNLNYDNENIIRFYARLNEYDYDRTEIQEIDSDVSLATLGFNFNDPETLIDRSETYIPVNFTVTGLLASNYSGGGGEYQISNVSHETIVEAKMGTYVDSETGRTYTSDGYVILRDKYDIFNTKIGFVGVAPTTTTTTTIPITGTTTTTTVAPTTTTTTTYIPITGITNLYTGCSGWTYGDSGGTGWTSWTELTPGLDYMSQNTTNGTYIGSDTGPSDTTIDVLTLHDTTGYTGSGSDWQLVKTTPNTRELDTEQDHLIIYWARIIDYGSNPVVGTTAGYFRPLIESDLNVTQYANIFIRLADDFPHYQAVFTVNEATGTDMATGDYMSSEWREFYHYIRNKNYNGTGTTGAIYDLSGNTVDPSPSALQDWKFNPDYTGSTYAVNLQFSLYSTDAKVNFTCPKIYELANATNCECSQTNIILSVSEYPTSYFSTINLAQRLDIEGTLHNINQKFEVTGSPDFDVVMNVYSGYFTGTTYPTESDLIATSINSYHASELGGWEIIPAGGGDDDFDLSTTPYCFRFNDVAISGETTYIIEYENVVLNNIDNNILIQGGTPSEAANSGPLMYYSSSWTTVSDSRLWGNVCYSAT